MTRQSVYTLVIVLSVLAFSPSTAQLISDQIVPKPLPTTGEASLIGQINGEPYLVVRSGYDDYIPFFEQWYGLYEASLLRVGQNGIPTRLAAFDTSRYEYWGLGGWDDLMDYSTAPNRAASEILIAWHRQRAYWSDVPPPNSNRPVARFASVSPTGISPLRVVDSSQSPRCAVDAVGRPHFVWEQRTPFPYRPYPGGFTYDSNYFFATGKIVYQMHNSGVSPSIIGRGFHPLIAIDEQDTVHIVWLRADSSYSPNADLMYCRGKNQVFSEPETLRLSLPFVDPYSQHQIQERTRLLSLSVQAGGPARIFWTGPRNSGSSFLQLYILTRMRAGERRLDSLAQTQVDYLVSPGGIIHALWSSHQGGLYALQYATSASNPPFSDTRTFHLRNSGGTAKLLRNSSGVLSAVTRDGTVLGYIPDLAIGPDTLIPFGVNGYYPSGNFAMLGDEGRIWVLYGRSFVTNQSDTLRLLQFEPIILSVGASEHLPQKFMLHQNYPNPFNPSTTIKYELPEGGLVSMQVFDILGREVATLVNGQHQAGYYSTMFDAKDLSSGVYLVRLGVTNHLGQMRFMKTNKLILAK